MSAPPTVDDQVAMVADVHEVGAIDLTAAVVILLAATGMRAGLCRRLLEQQVEVRRSDWVPLRDWDWRWAR